MAEAGIDYQVLEIQGEIRLIVAYFLEHWHETEVAELLTEQGAVGLLGEPKHSLLASIGIVV